MRYLFCSLTTPESLNPMVGLALELRGRGHEVAFATGSAAQPVLDGAGLRRIPRREVGGDTFRHQPSPVASVVALDVRHIEDARAVFAPDVLVASEFVLAAYVAHELYGIPLCVMDEAAYLCPRPDLVRPLDEARALFGLPAREADGDYPLPGDLLLVRSVPELDPEPVPPHVRFVGACQWEPAADAPEPWREECGRAAADGDRVLYVRHRRVATEPLFWPQLVEALEPAPVRVLASVAAWDPHPDELPPRFTAGDAVPRTVVLPHAALAVAGANSSASMDALAHGVPSVLVWERGQGGDHHVQRLERAGCATRIDSDDLTAERLREVVHATLDDDGMRRNAARLRDAFARFEGFRAAADAVEQLQPAGR